MIRKDWACALTEDLLPLYLEGEVCKDTEQRMQYHLSQCEGCRKTYELMNSDVTDVFKATRQKNRKRIKRFKRILPWIFFWGYLGILILLCCFFVLDIKIFSMR